LHGCELEREAPEIHEAFASSATERKIMEICTGDTAVVLIDPQNDVLSETGTSWGAVGASVTENHTVENLDRLLGAAKSGGFEVFISPHYFYPTDRGWQLNGPLEAEEFATGTFARSGPLSLAGFEGSGADWLDRFKRYIDDGKTIVVNPHKVFGPQTNDLVLQLRKRRISRIVLGGMLANLCVESHLRELLEGGLRGRRRQGCDRGAAPPRMGRWLSGGDDQLSIPRPRGAVDRRSGRGAPARGRDEHARGREVGMRRLAIRAANQGVGGSFFHSWRRERSASGGFIAVLAPD
jgi:nicotinamidase-related amidase